MCVIFQEKGKIKEKLALKDKLSRTQKTQILLQEWHSIALCLKVVIQTLRILDLSTNKKKKGPYLDLSGSFLVQLTSVWVLIGFKQSLTT